ncbi:MAG: nucleotidyl transferase AbiEii/AbiGii toxin family protein [Candidatus Vogelbacteria bacterium]|nr:nucleotidyl transferase AbiEii/AbiGii toxin family protein [Candidatus Vogelbacteria bacterium]
MASPGLVILSKEQVAFLQIAGKYQLIADEYYLTGGTPLAAFYLGHRYSEDLDFFIEKSEVNILAIKKFIRSVQRKFSFKKITYQNYQGLHMFFLEYPNGVTLKVDFNYYPFSRIETGKREFGVLIDSLHDIAVNKIQTIATRTTAKDFIDLYCIVTNTDFNISQLIKDARIKFDWHIGPMQFGKQFLKVTELKDLPRMIAPVAEHEWKKFFIEEAKKLKPEILE